jgi:hypothetical protein
MKIETVLVIVGLAGVYTGTGSEYVELRNGVIDYYCGHYKQLEETDEGAFNEPKVYAKIYQTCRALKLS